MSTAHWKPLLASSLLLYVGAEAAGGAGQGELTWPDPEDRLEVEVDVALVSEEGPSLTFSWRGKLGREGPWAGGDYSTRSEKGLLLTGGAGFGFAPPHAVHVGFHRWEETGKTRFWIGVTGSCPEQGTSEEVLNVSTEDESPFALTEREYEGGFERSFAFTTLAGACHVYGEATVHVTLRKNPVEAVLVTDEGYDAWRPEADKDEDTPGNRLAVSVVLQKKGSPGVKPKQTARFTLELLSPAGGGSTRRGSSREKGVCLNAPPKDEARSTYDLGFRKEGNPLLAKVAQDGQSAETKDGLQEAKVSVTSYDWGAYGKLRVTAVLSNGLEVAAHWQRKPDRTELAIPLDENGNRIADGWERNEGIFEQNLAADWDGANDPGLQKADGDGISLYEKYRGFEVETGHERLRPKQKYLFVHDPAEIVRLTQAARASFDTGFAKVSQLNVLFIDNHQWTGPGSQLDGRRIVNFNHGFGHAVDQHALHVEKAVSGDTPEGWRRFLKKYLPQGPTEVASDLAGVALFDHPFAYGSPRSVYRINIYPDVIFAALMKGFLRANAQRMQDSLRACERQPEHLRCVEQALDQILGDLTGRPDALDAFMMMVTLTVSHELGHGVGIDHHHPETEGDRRCVMRYQAPEKECPASPEDPYYLKCYQPWPDRISRDRPERCWQSVKVTDRAR